MPSVKKECYESLGQLKYFIGDVYWTKKINLELKTAIKAINYDS